MWLHQNGIRREARALLPQRAHAGTDGARVLCVGVLLEVALSALDGPVEVPGPLERARARSTRAVGSERSAKARLGGPPVSSFVDFHTHDFTGGFSEPFSEPRSLDTLRCLETHMRVRAAGGSYEAWWNVVSVARVEMANTLTAPPATFIGVGGAWRSAGSAERCVYVDEVVADTTRLGCYP